ncbi:hypothetical protein PRIPAC_97026 [Pristionchus pacificus]|uniref:Uncharacterized protein n=1 Tax=Pristionchus pacificus TaxID=54126 RepID=A0A2A6BD02_PRIPA|nr:hypothetical protein PRIPAC_97026 [Pristionchus pacificus]|eukprot:PDM63711.1 hypothetical protein PRIPAC_49684 [Pristionchus pacificus]
MDSPFERPQNPTPPPSSPSTPLEGGEFIFPSASHTLTRQISEVRSSDGYETDSQLGDDVPLSLTASSSMESLPTDEQSPFLLAPLNFRFFVGYGGKQPFPPPLNRFMVTYRRNTVDDQEDEDAAKRMRTESSVESEDDETPTDESTFIVESKGNRREKSDDDDLYEF